MGKASQHLGSNEPDLLRFKRFAAANLPAFLGARQGGATRRWRGGGGASEPAGLR